MNANVNSPRTCLPGHACSAHIIRAYIDTPGAPDASVRICTRAHVVTFGFCSVRSCVVSIVNNAIVFPIAIEVSTWSALTVFTIRYRSAGNVSVACNIVFSRNLYICILEKSDVRFCATCCDFNSNVFAYCIRLHIWKERKFVSDGRPSLSNRNKGVGIRVLISIDHEEGGAS